MTVSISPVFNGQQFFDNDGFPLSGGKLFQYEAGSNSVQRTSYADDTGTTPNSNPIVLDSSGRMDTDIWLTDGEAYNLVLTQADGTTVLTGVDDVIGVVSSSSSSSSTAIWVEILDAPTYIGPTQFLLPGNVTNEFAVGNRVQVEYTTNDFKYGTVVSRTFSSPNTQVTLVNDATVQNAGMTKVYWSLNSTIGRTVDAGAVTWNAPSTYTTPLTVGYELNALNDDVTALNTRVDSTYKVWDTAGTTAAFTITPSPAITAYTVGQIFVVKFNAVAAPGATINVNGLGAILLRQYTSAGAKVLPTTFNGMVTQIGYDGTDFIVLDQLPPATSAIVSGLEYFSSSGSFVVPAGVSTVKVTCMGGGGGGGQGQTTGDIETGFFNYRGGSGGLGGTTITYHSVTPAASLSVVIGAGGIGTNTVGGTGGTTTFNGAAQTATGGLGGSATANGATGGAGSTGTRISTYLYAGFGGIGGLGAGATGTAGTAGAVLVEW